MRITYKKYLFWVFLFLASYSYAQGQGDSTQTDQDIYVFTINEILNLPVEGLREKKIYSVSKNTENWVNNPLSSYVINQEEIERAGVMNVPEALRLAPGMIVRQKMNGIYDVHIRGLDNISQDGYIRDSENSGILVLVDQVPYYDYFQGGAFWESLPISIHDIERIEIIHLPHQVVFGSNAVSGLVHIITKKVNERGLSGDFNAQGGTNSTYLYQGALNYGVNDKLRLRLSGNYQFGERFQDRIFVLTQNRDISSDSLLFVKSDAVATNINTELAYQRYGVNAYASWDIDNNIQLQGLYANQSSQIQSVFHDDTLALTSRKNQSNLLSLSGNIYNALVQVSHRFGTQESAIGYPGLQFDHSHFNAFAEYNYQFRNLNLRPGFQYQSITYDNTSSLNESDSTVLLNRKANINDISFYVQGNLKFFEEKLSLMGGIRLNKYNVVDQVQLAFQLAGAYSLNEKHLLRFAVSKGNRSPLVRDFLTNGEERFPTDGITRQRMQDTDLKLYQVFTVEAGYRTRVFQNVEAQIELFSNNSQNYLYDRFEMPNDSTFQAFRANADLKARQFGGSLLLEAIISKLKIGAFFTYQQTRVKNLMNSEGQPEDLSYEGTPNFYGGVTFNFNTLFNRLNINSQVYFFGSQNFQSLYANRDINAKFITNLKVSYRIWKTNQIFLNARNLFNQSSKEFAFSDNTQGLYLVGLNFGF